MAELQVRDLFFDADRADRARAEPVPGMPSGPGRDAAASVEEGAAQTQVLMRGVAQEGWEALADPTGLIDRQQAQAELRGNFEIVAPGAARDSPTQITEDEFEHLARLYSDIRRGHTKLQLAPDPRQGEGAQLAFRRNMMGQLGRILQTASGRTLIESLAHNPHDNTINLMPLLDVAGHARRDNAFADAQFEANARDPARGTGAHVQVNPGVDAFAVGRPGDAWRNARGDVTLFHELVHAYHEVHGTLAASAPVTAPGLDGSTRDADAGVKQLEHQAVGLGAFAPGGAPPRRGFMGLPLPPLTENAYRAERARIGAHGGATAVGAVDGLAGTADRGMPQRLDYHD